MPVEEDEESRLRGHTVICGYGGVGSVIGEALLRRGFPFIVIDQDMEVITGLREQGIPALLGNADNRVLLDLVHLEHARVLVLAIGDSVTARRVLDRARQVNPRLNIVARVHDVDESMQMTERGANAAFIGELELALEMARYTLRRYGLSTVETQAIIQGFRTAQSRQVRRVQDETE
jgi:CPA2 family monovalent cation:H+ antiporter-2